MKRLLVALLLLSGVAHADTVGSPLIGTRLRIIPTTAPQDCDAPRKCLWFDTNTNTFKQRIDGVDTTLGGGIATGIQSVKTEGTLTVQGNIQGADATNNNFLRLVPGTGEPPFMFWSGLFDSGDPSRKDHVVRWGHNCGIGGGLHVAGKGALCSEMEDYFIGGHTQMERHDSYVDPTGSVHRIWSYLSNLAAPYDSVLFLNAETVNVGPVGGGVVSTGPTTAGMASPNVGAVPGTLSTVFVDDTQAWIKAGTNKASAIASANGEFAIHSDSNTTVDVGGQGHLNASGTTVWEWGAGFTAQFAPHLMIGSDASGGNPTQPSPILYLRGNYWSGSASTLYDARTTLVVDSTTPTAHVLWEMGGTNEVMRLSGAGVLGLSVPSGNTAALDLSTGGSASVSASNHGKIIYDQSAQHFKISENGGAYSTLGGSGGVTSLTGGGGITVSASTGSVTLGASGIAESAITNLTTDLAAKAIATRTISTTSPITGGGDLSADRTFACATCVVTGGSTMTGPFVFSGTQTGTYTLAGTPTITSPAVSGPTLSGTVAGTYSLGGTPTISAAVSVTAAATFQQATTTGQVIAATFGTSTAATVGAQKNSTYTEWTGNGWKTTSTAASQPVGWGFFARPLQGATNPDVEGVWMQNINGTLTEKLKIWAPPGSGTLLVTPAAFTLREGAGNNAVYCDNAIGGCALQVGAVTKFNVTGSAMVSAVGWRPKRIAVADTNYTVLLDDHYVMYSSISATRTVTMPAANSVTIGGSGRTFLIGDESGSCAAGVKITLARSGSDTINGATSFDACAAAYGAKECESDGTSKWTCH